MIEPEMDRRRLLLVEDVEVPLEFVGVVIELLMLEDVVAVTRLVEPDGSPEGAEELEDGEVDGEVVLGIIELDSDSRELLLLEYVEVLDPLPLKLVGDELELVLPKNDEVLVTGAFELDEEELELLI